MAVADVPDRPTTPYVDDGVPRLVVGDTGSGPVEYRPNDLMVDLGALDLDADDPEQIVKALWRLARVRVTVDEADFRLAQFSRVVRVRLVDDKADPLAIAERVNARLDRPAFAPNVVFRIDALVADPMRFAGSLGADPMRFASAFGVDPMRFANSSTARPARKPVDLLDQPRVVAGPGKPTVAILDTGFPAVGRRPRGHIDFGGVREAPDLNGDQYLDIAAGHSTFIRTIIQRACGAADVLVHGVMENDGDGDEQDVARALADVHATVADKSRLVLNLSFSGYYVDDREPPHIAFWIRQLVDAGAVVVAAAGNDGRCRRKYPAAMPEVVSVGSVGPCGRSVFSNHGPWVDVSAPGEDLVSEFFSGFDGAFEATQPTTLPDPDDFQGWAKWSGTSFSTAIIVGALSELIELHDVSARDALARLVGRPGLFRVPDSGVIVNRIY